MWPYPRTHLGTPSHPGHLDRMAATLPSQAPAGAVPLAPELEQWEGQDVPSVRPSSCIVNGGNSSSQRYLPTYLPISQDHPPEAQREATTGREACERDGQIHED